MLLIAVPPAAAEGSNGIPVGRLARDPVLDGLIAAAVANHPAIAAKRSGVAAARFDIDAARGQYAPSLSTLLRGGSGSNSQYGSTVRVDQRLYAGGRLDAELDSAASRRDASLFDVQQAALTLAEQVVGAYQSLQVAEAQERAIDAYRSRLEELAASLARRIDGGASPRSDESLMNARMAESATSLTSARTAALVAQTVLRRLAGPAAGSASNAAPVPETTAPATSMPICASDAGGEAARRAAVDRHPALMRSLLDLEAARFALEGQRSTLKPSVTLRVERPVGGVPEGTPRGARVALVLEYTTDAALSAASRIDAGAQRLVALRDEAESLRREIEQQLLAECAEYAGIVRRLLSLAEVRRHTGDVLSSYTRLFGAGKRAWLDVLNAAREDFENEEAAFTTAATLRGSAYRLALLGGNFALGQPGPEGPAEHPLLRVFAGSPP